MGYWVYIVRCGNNTLYTGVTTDVQRRLKQHNECKGAKYTAAHLPVVLAGAWEVPSWNDALRLEALVKKCPRKAKEELILEPERMKHLAGTKGIKIIDQNNK